MFYPPFFSLDAYRFLFWFWVIQRAVLFTTEACTQWSAVAYFFFYVMTILAVLPLPQMIIRLSGEATWYNPLKWARKLVRRALPVIKAELPALLLTTMGGLSVVGFVIMDSVVFNPKVVTGEAALTFGRPLALFALRVLVDRSLMRGALSLTQMPSFRLFGFVHAQIDVGLIAMRGPAGASSWGELFIILGIDWVSMLWRMLMISLGCGVLSTDGQSCLARFGRLLRCINESLRTKPFPGVNRSQMRMFEFIFGSLSLTGGSISLLFAAAYFKLAGFGRGDAVYDFWLPQDKSVQYSLVSLVSEVMQDFVAHLLITVAARAAAQRDGTPVCGFTRIFPGMLTMRSAPGLLGLKFYIQVCSVTALWSFCLTQIGYILRDLEYI
jgi:hypothetical protein